MKYLTADVTPKLFSVAGGFLLILGISIPAFVLLALSALANLITSVRQKNKNNALFFGAWASFNTYFAIHGH
jgi:apolipoprotein N-acyltransferase